MFFRFWFYSFSQKYLSSSTGWWSKAAEPTIKSFLFCLPFLLLFLPTLFFFELVRTRTYKSVVSTILVNMDSKDTWCLSVGLHSHFLRGGNFSDNDNDKKPMFEMSELSSKTWRTIQGFQFEDEIALKNRENYWNQTNISNSCWIYSDKCKTNKLGFYWLSVQSNTKHYHNFFVIGYLILLMEFNWLKYPGFVFSLSW